MPPFTVNLCSHARPRQPLMDFLALSLKAGVGRGARSEQGYAVNLEGVQSTERGWSFLCSSMLSIARRQALCWKLGENG